MSNFQQIAGGVAGGIIGAIIGGPAGAIAGFSLGLGIASTLFPADLGGDPQKTDAFEITAATEGTPVPIVLGRRKVSGNVIYFDFDSVEIEEIVDGGGKGKAAGGGVIELRAFAPVHIVLACGDLQALHGIRDGKNRDWELLNSDYGGDPIQISTGTGTDFGYAASASPMPGVTSVFSSRLFLGENSTRMTSLDFEIEIWPTVALGVPTAGLSEGVNPASVILTLLQWEQVAVNIPSAAINLDSFQAAYDLFRDEDRGVSVFVDRLTQADKVIDAVLFHCNAMIREDDLGRVELWPIRSDNYTLIPIPDEDINGINVGTATWQFVETEFVATFEDRSQDYTSRTIRAVNEAAQDVTGSRKVRTYNFPFFTDIANADRRLQELKDQRAYPSPAVSMGLPLKYHKLRKGDVVSVTCRKTGFVDRKMRILEIQYAEFGKAEMRLKLRFERDPLVISYAPAPTPDAPTPDPSPRDPLGVEVLPRPWRHHPQVPPGVPGDPPGNSLPPVPSPIIPVPLSPVPLYPMYAGWPLHVLAARGKGTDIGFVADLRHAPLDELPQSVQGRTPSRRWSFLFNLREDVPAGEWRYAAGLALELDLVGYPNQVFGRPDHDDVDGNSFPVDLEVSPWCLVVGGTEVWRWRTATRVGGTHYRFEGVIRAVNKESARAWPAGTKMWVADLRTPQLPDTMEYLDWANRTRYIRQADYDDPMIRARVRAWVQSINHLGQLQGPSEGFGGPDGITFEDQAHADPAVRSSIYAPENEIHANRGPMPACQCWIRGDAAGDRRAWYTDPGLGAAGDFVIEFQPFPDDETGTGDGVVYDATGAGSGPPEDTWGSWPLIGTDKAYADLVGPDSPSNGHTYRLWVIEDETQTIEQAVRTADLVIDAGMTAWPSFIYTAAEQAADGITDPTRLVFLVAIIGGDSAHCRPRVADRVGALRPLTYQGRTV